MCSETERNFAGPDRQLSILLSVLDAVGDDLPCERILNLFQLSVEKKKNQVHH